MDERRAHRWPQPLAGQQQRIWYGGDYNPDQWPEEVWDEDIRLMRRAGVNTVALGIFSWDRIQPQKDRWDFGWLDRIIDKLGEAGIGVDLASATATAPMWLYEQYPEVLPWDRFGHPVQAGTRQSWSASSPVFREFALTMCRTLARRYGEHPAVVAWHVGNEYGWNNRHDYSDQAQASFRRWCREKYGTIEALNEAWGTSFWSQELQSFDEVLVPRFMGADTMVNPGHQLDFERFGSDELKRFYCAERDAIVEICPDKPCTTNFMVSTDQCVMDYPDWASEVDFLSNDHYFHEGPSHIDELCCSGALMSSMALNKPWYLMEHSTSAVQWKTFNARKRHGELIRDALAHVGMGADAVCFFQWRQSKFGAEAFHSAMVPHAGEDSQVYREVCELGQALETLSQSGLVGAGVRPADTAILFDAQSQWASWSKTLPSQSLDHWHEVRDWYRGFLDAGRRADVVPLSYDWSGYRLIVLPGVLALSVQDTERLEAFVREGGTVVVGYATGLIDERFHTWLGGYPGAGNGVLREMLGVRSEEINTVAPAPEPGEAQHIEMSNGALSQLWQHVVTSVASDAQVLATYTGEGADDWELDGTPAVVRHPYGQGVAYFVGCDLRVQDIARLIREHIGSDLAPAAESDTAGDTVDDPRFIHTVRCTDDGAVFDFYMLRGRETATVRVDGDVVVAYRCGRVDGDTGEISTYRFDRNGILVSRRQ